MSSCLPLSTGRVYSDWAYFLFSIGFSVLLGGKIIVDKYIAGVDHETTVPAHQTDNYKNMGDMA